MDELLKMSAKELSRLEVMQRLVEKRMSQKEAGRVLHRSTRQIKRLLKAYRKQGAAGLLSKRCGYKGNNRLAEDVKIRALNLLKTKYKYSNVRRLEERVTTVSFRLKDMHPRVVAEELAQQGIYVWDGNYYAINVTERLRLEESGGMVRVGTIHYNTLEEVERLKEVLMKIATD